MLISGLSTPFHWSAAAKSLQSCPTLCDPIDPIAHQAPPSLGFSRQEHWSGLPFPSPMHESDKWKWSRSVVSDSARPHRGQPTRLPLPWDSPGKSTGVSCHFLDLCVCFYANTTLFCLPQFCNIGGKQKSRCLLLCFFSRFLCLFRVFYGSIQILGLFILFLWKMPLEFW